MKIQKKFDKLSLQIYLFYFKIFKKSRISEKDGAILVLADLLLGDLAMAGFYIQGLRSLYPHRKIVLLCKRNLEDVAQLFKVDKVISANYLGWRAFNLIKDASPEGYGRVVNIFSGKWLPILNGLRVGVVSGFPNKRASKEFKLDEVFKIPSSPVAAAELIFNNLPPIKMADLAKLNFTKLATTKPLVEFTHYFVLHIGASNELRLWPINFLQNLIDELARNNANLVITGLEQNGAYMDRFNNIVKNQSQKMNLINLIGKTSLLELLSIVKNSKGVISVDTGIIHWSRLMEIPNLSVLGPSSEALYGANSYLLKNSFTVAVNNLDCREKKTFHGIHLTWLENCQKDVCSHEKRLCFERINQSELSCAVLKLISKA